MISYHRFLALVLALTVNAAMAQEVSVDIAKSHALDFLSKQSVGPKRAKGQQVAQDLSLAYISKSEAKTCFYVFNVGDDEGFVIAGGDESARQILGYCDHGTFDYDKAPDNFKWWLSQYTEQIEHAEAAPVDAAATTARRAKKATSRVNIGPLIQTKWDQTYPYNSEIPVYDSSGEPYVTGCVATAMAQVMYYHKWPATNGTGSHEYKYNKITFSANFEETTYDWDNMLLSYDGDFSDTQAQAVGTLMYHAGVSIYMKYGINASNAASKDVGSALVKFYGYDRSVRNEMRTYYTDEDWEDLVYSELSANRPVLYSGTASGGSGHAFICDGYDVNRDMFYINWGWSGFCDGSFTLTGNGALKPNGSGSGGAAGSAYVLNQEIAVNVMPDRGGIESPHFVLPYFDTMTNPLSMKVNDKTYEDNYHYDKETGYQKLVLTYSVMNISCVFDNLSYFKEGSKYISLGVKAIDRDYGNVCYFYSDAIMLLTNDAKEYSWTNHTTDIDLSQFEYNGTYELRPVYRINGTEEWNDIEIPIYETIPTVVITGAQDRLIREVKISISNQVLKVGETAQITHDSYFQGAITYNSSNPSVATVDVQGIVTGVSEGSTVITVKTESDAEGLYLPTEKAFNVHVTGFTKKDFIFTLDQTRVDTGDQISICWDYDYDGVLTFTSSNPEIATVDEYGNIMGVAEGTVEITAKATETADYYVGEATFTIEVIYLKITLVEEPYFNNENNAYEDDLVMHFKIRNDCNVSHDAIINAHYQVESVGGVKSFKITSALPGHIYSSTIDFQSITWGSRPPVANKQYTIYLTMNNDQPFEDYSSITFTYRDKLELDYGVSPAGYGTLILPFNAELPEGMTVYGCPSVDENGVLTLVEESSISRNKPYIVKATYGTTYHFKGPEAIDADKPSFTEGILVGAVGKNVPLVAGTDYILQEQNNKVAFYKYTGTPSDNPDENVDGNRLAKQFRAFLRLSYSSKPAKFNLPGFSDDETEGITTITTDNFLSAGIYSIDGKRQSSFQKGLNILILEDGAAQKVFVK